MPEKEPQYSSEDNERLIIALEYLEKIRLRQFNPDELKEMLMLVDARDAENEKIMDQYLTNGQILDFCRDAIVDVLNDEYGINAYEDSL